MSGAIHFYEPAGQQQSNHDTQNQLFLFRQEIHDVNVIGKSETASHRAGEIAKNGIRDSKTFDLIQSGEMKSRS